MIENTASNNPPIESEQLLQLDNQLCFMLYSSSRAMTKLYRPLLTTLNLTYPQYLVMLVLWEWHDQPKSDQHTVKALGKRLYLDSGTLTPLLKRLEKVGYIYRKRSEDDERELQLSLTESGLTLKQKALSVPEKLLCQSQTPLTELTKLREQLRQLLEQLHQFEN